MSEPAVLTPRAQQERALCRIARDNVSAARGLNDAVLVAAGRLGANLLLGDVRPSLFPDVACPVPPYHAAHAMPPPILHGYARQ